MIEAENLKPREIHLLASVVFLYIFFLAVRAGLSMQLFPAKRMECCEF